MKCVVCRHEETKLGSTTLTLERGTPTAVIKHVPAQVCENCDEAYLDEATTQRVMDLAEAAVKQGAVVQVQEFAVA